MKIQLREGEAYTCGEPVAVGVITPRVELIAADPPSGRTPGIWCDRVYSGSEVYLVVDDQVILEPVMTQDGLKEGDKVLCPSLAGDFRATILTGTFGNLFAQGDEDEHHVGWLEFAKDDRACWTCSGTAYLKNLTRLPTYQEAG